MLSYGTGLCCTGLSPDPSDTGAILLYKRSLDALQTETELCWGLQEERIPVSVQEGADLPLHHLRLEAPHQPSLWKEQYQVGPFTSPAASGYRDARNNILTIHKYTNILLVSVSSLASWVARASVQCAHVTTYHSPCSAGRCSSDVPQIVLSACVGNDIVNCVHWRSSVWDTCAVRGLRTLSWCHTC